MATKDLYPSIRPSLNLDFANSKTLDPRITFSRASAATYYDGKTVAKAEENLVTQPNNSANFTNTTEYTKSDNAGTAPDGTFTAMLFTVSSANVLRTLGTRSLAVTPGLSYVISFFAKANGHNFIRFGNGANNKAYCTFDLQNLTVSDSGGPEYSGAGVVPVKDGWVRCWVKFTSSTQLALGLVSMPSALSTDFYGRATYQGDGSSGVYLWGLQLEQRDSVTTYTPTTTQPITNYIPVLQTAPAGVPRFDHNPITGESLGLLVEEQRTNLCKWSEDFTNSVWLRTGWNTTPNQAIAPDGSLTADLVVGIGAGQVVSTVIATSVSGAHTFSAYLKPVSNMGGTYSFLIRNVTTSENIAIVSLNWSSMTVTGPGAITALANGWYRLYVTAASGISAGDTLQVYPISANAPGHSFFLWGTQLEAGAFPTSYIKTEASQVTRVADSASMIGANFSSWYRQDEGTLCAELSSTSNALPQNGGIASLVDAASVLAGSVVLYASTVALAATVYAGGQLQATMSLAVVNSANSKAAVSYAFNDIRFCCNGSEAQVDSTAMLPSVNSLAIGRWAGNPGALTGRIKRLSYYPKRLSNAQLQALTA